MPSSKLERRAYNFGLLLFVVLSLPAATLLLWLNYAAVVLVEQKTRFRSRKQLKVSKTVLITGASTAHGLNVAQAFYKEGHRVVAVGLHAAAILNIARRSRAISKHYDIPYSSATQDASYLARCLFIVAKQESADLWVDCSQDISLEVITSAQQQIREGTTCLCIAADHASLQLLRNREALLHFLRDKRLPAPEVYPVRSRGEIHNVLNRSRSQGKKQFLLKSSEKPKPFDPREMLPRRTVSQTYQEISLLKIAPGSQLLLEEYVDTSNTYQCSIIVVKGVVKLFSAKQLTGDLNTNFGDRSALWKAFRAYTDSIASELGPTFTSHLTLVFLLNEIVSNAGVEQQVRPIEGRLNLDPFFVFPRPTKAPNDLVLAYMSALQHDTNGTTGTHSLAAEQEVQMPVSDAARDVPRQRYFLSEDAEKLAFDPWVRLLLRRKSLAQVAASVLTLSHRILFYDEAYYSFYDPFPAYYQYTVVLAWRTLVGT